MKVWKYYKNILFKIYSSYTYYIMKGTMINFSIIKKMIALKWKFNIMYAQIKWNARCIEDGMRGLLCLKKNIRHNPNTEYSDRYPLPSRGLMAA